MLQRFQSVDLFDETETVAAVEGNVSSDANASFSSVLADSDDADGNNDRLVATAYFLFRNNIAKESKYYLLFLVLSNLFCGLRINKYEHRLF